MDLKFTTRRGSEKAFERGLCLTDDEGRERLFYLVMRTANDKARIGEIFRGRRNHDGTILPADASNPVWKGELPEGPPPTRAFAVAAGLCDDTGNTNLPLPSWVRS